MARGVDLLLAYKTTLKVPSVPNVWEGRTKLPEVRTNKSVPDQTIRDLKWNHKPAGKMYTSNAMLSTTLLLPKTRFFSKTPKKSGELVPKFDS